MEKTRRSSLLAPRTTGSTPPGEEGRDARRLGEGRERAQERALVRAIASPPRESVTSTDRFLAGQPAGPGRDKRGRDAEHDERHRNGRFRTSRISGVSSASPWDRARCRWSRNSAACDDRVDQVLRLDAPRR